MLISIEGISGVGKSTLARNLSSQLDPAKRPLVVGGFEVTETSSVITQFCRDLVTQQRFMGLPWIAEIHLLLSELAHDIEIQVIPALANKQTVIFDGYFDSLIAFQFARLTQIEGSSEKREYLTAQVMEMKKILAAPEPEITFFLTGDGNRIAKRLVERDNLLFTPEHSNLQKLINNEYLNIFRRVRDRQILTINTDQQSSSEIALGALQSISSILG